MCLYVLLDFHFEILTSEPALGSIQTIHVCYPHMALAGSREAIWETSQRRMNELFPRRPKGNLMLYCPACPEPDVNMESGWERTPSHLW